MCNINRKVHREAAQSSAKNLKEGERKIVEENASRVGTQENVCSSV